jgi:hypothetical protein
MFNSIVNYLEKNKNIFFNKGVYFENKPNSWLTFIPKKNYIEIQWKNNGYKKQRINVENINSDILKDAEEIWENELKNLKIEKNIKEIYKNKEKKDFEYYFLTGQSFFRKNNRIFELGLKEKIKYSNESLSYDDHFLNYNIFFFLLKQFRIKFFIENELLIKHNIKEDFIILEIGGNVFNIRTPLELKIIMEENVEKCLKEKIKEEFSLKALNQLSKYVDLKYTGTERILKTYLV